MINIKQIKKDWEDHCTEHDLKGKFCTYNWYHGSFLYIETGQGFIKHESWRDDSAIQIKDNKFIFLENERDIYNHVVESFYKKLVDTENEI